MIKIGDKDVKKIYVGDKPVKKVMLGDKQIWPSYSSVEYYNGFWNTDPSGERIETVNVSLEGNSIKGNVNNSWYFLCHKNDNPTIDNPCVGYNDNGNAIRKYDLFWSKGKNCWVWLDTTLGDDNTGKYRYISKSDAEARQNKSTNRAGLIL